jgi:hypothetical protein
LLPVITTDAVARMAQLFPDNMTFRTLTELTERARKVPRGLDVARDFLQRVLPTMDLLVDNDQWLRVGQLLDWCGLCRVLPRDWPTLRDNLFSPLGVMDLPMEAFISCAQGIFRCDADAYRAWFIQHQGNVLGYLQWQTRALTLQVDEDILSARFFLDYGEAERAHDQVMSRLYKLRSAVPFCQRYQAQGVSFLPFGLTPSHDPTHKDMPRENLHLLSDLEKNGVWARTVELAYLPDSHFRHQQAWHTLRIEALGFARVLNKGMQRRLEGRSFDYHAGFEQGALLERLNLALKDLPDPPPQMLLTDKTVFKEAPMKWQFHLNNVFHQFVQYVSNPEDMDVRRLVLHNLKEVVHLLPRMHTAFAQLFEHVPDYFSLADIDERENAVYPSLAARLELVLLDPPSQPVADVTRLVATREALSHRETIARVAAALSTLSSAGLTATLPSDVYDEHPLRYIAVGFSVTAPAFPERELEMVLQALADIESGVDMYCLVPLYGGAPFMDGGYQVSTLQLQQLKNGDTFSWETMVPRPLPEQAVRQLALPPVQTHATLLLRARVSALFIAADMLKNTAEALLATDRSNRFVRRLVEEELTRTRAHLDTIAAEVPAIQAEIREVLSDNTDSEASAAYAVVDNILVAIFEATQNGMLEGLVQLSLEDGIASLTRLLSRGV